jgi:hypothetical protein
MNGAIGPIRAHALRALAAVAIPLLLAGCGSSGSGRAQGAVVNVRERDFHIEAPEHISPGRVLLRVSNEGPDEHELIVAPTGPGGPPIRSDGITVNEEAIEASEPGSLEPGQPGRVRYLSLDLKPGRYLFFCNMEGHFMGGMHHEVVVD